MPRSDSFQVKWASAPDQFERPLDTLITRGWAGGANEAPPEASYENWWHNRVDEALAEIEANGAPTWFADVPYTVGAVVRSGGKNWLAEAGSTGVQPGSVDDTGYWHELGGYATASEAQALSSLTKLLSPGRLADAFKGTNQQLQQNGYQKLPGGLIVQWMGVTSSDFTNPVTFTLPIAYPNEHLRAFAAQDASSKSSATVSVGASPSGLSSVNAASESTSGDSFYILSIGY